MIFKAGDTAYILENSIRVKSVKILNRIGDMYTVRIDRGAICLRHTRLFGTEAEAKKHMIKLEGPDNSACSVEPKRNGYRSPYDYWY